MITAKGRFATVTCDGVNIVIHRRQSLLGTNTVTIPIRDISTVDEGRSSFFEHYIRFVAPGAPDINRRSRSVLARDPLTVLFWTSRAGEFRALVRLVRARG